jgi:hypothetical protein
LAANLPKLRRGKKYFGIGVEADSKLQKARFARLAVDITPGYSCQTLLWLGLRG